MNPTSALTADRYLRESVWTWKLSRSAPTADDRRMYHRQSWEYLVLWGFYESGAA